MAILKQPPLWEEQFRYGSVTCVFWLHRANQVYAYKRFSVITEITACVIVN